MKSIFFSCCLIFILHTSWSQGQWPRDIETAQAKITMYQPQPESFSGDKLSGRAAVAITSPAQPPIFGAVWINTRVATDRDKRTVTWLTRK